MNFSAKSNKIDSLASRCLVVGVYSGSRAKLSASAQLLDKASKKAISTIVKKGDISGEAGSTMMLYDIAGLAAERVMLVGLGQESKVNAGSLRKAAAAAASLANKNGIRSLDLSLFDKNYGRMDAARMARNAVEAISVALYRYEETKSGRKKPQPLKSVSLLLSDPLWPKQKKA